VHLQSCLFFGNFAHKLIIIYNETFMNAFSDGAEIIMRNDVENELAAASHSDLLHHIAAAVHITLGILDHALNHLAADPACIAGGNIAVVTIIKGYIHRVSDLGFKVLQRLLRLGNCNTIAPCHKFSPPFIAVRFKSLSPQLRFKADVI